MQNMRVTGVIMNDSEALWTVDRYNSLKCDTCGHVIPRAIIDKIICPVCFREYIMSMSLDNLKDFVDKYYVNYGDGILCLDKDKNFYMESEDGPFHADYLTEEYIRESIAGATWYIDNKDNFRLYGPIC